MIACVHAMAHIAINCIPINWNLPISFGMFRQAERAVEQISLRPVTPQDIECPSLSKEHRRRGKSYPDKAVSHGSIYNRCNTFLAKAVQSALASVTATPIAANTEANTSSSAVSSPALNAKETPEAPTNSRSNINSLTDVAETPTVSDTVEAAQKSRVAEIPTANNTTLTKLTESSVSTNSVSLSSDEAVMEDEVSCIDQSESETERVFYCDDTSSNNSTPAASPWASLEPEESLAKGKDATEVPQVSASKSKVRCTGARTDLSINKKNGELDLIGKGTFGSVYRGNYCGAEVAIKLTAVPSFRKETEGQVFARIGTHPHIIRLNTFYRDGYGTDMLETLVLDYAPADLSKMVNVIATDPCLDYTAFVADCLADALAHIHKRGYAHLDVSPGNVLLMRDGVPKLADFSSSLKWRIGDKPLEVYPVGTVGFRAPEVIEQHGYDTGADWFSLGVLVYYMINTRLPWERDDIAQMDFIRSGKPGLANALPAAFSSFVSDLLSDEPDLRITEDVLRFLTDEAEL